MTPLLGGSVPPPPLLCPKLSQFDVRIRTFSLWVSDRDDTSGTGAAGAWPLRFTGNHTIYSRGHTDFSRTGFYIKGQSRGRQPCRGWTHTRLCLAEAVGAEEIGSGTFQALPGHELDEGPWVK